MSEIKNEKINKRVRPSLRCAAGFHNDGTDAFGDFSPTCMRCYRPSWAPATSTFRGSAMSVFGVLLIFDSLMFARSSGNEIFGLVCGGVLFVLGLLMIWRQW